MASKQVTTKTKLALGSCAAIRTHDSKITQSLDSFLRPHLREGEKPPDLALVPELLARAIEDSIHDLTRTDVLHEVELADDQGARQLRDEQCDQLYGSMTDLRQFMALAVGPDAPARAGLTGDTPREPMSLKHHAEAVSKKLRSRSFEGSLPGAPFDANAWADRLDTESAALSTSIEAVARESRETEGTLADKYGALERFDRDFSKINQLAKSLLVMAGEGLLADKMSYTRSAGPTETDPEPTPVDPPVPEPTDED
jgi:hypothetical protein